MGPTLTVGLTFTIDTGPGAGSGVSLSFSLSFSFSFSLALGAAGGGTPGAGHVAGGALVPGEGLLGLGVLGALGGITVSVVSVRGKSVMISPSWDSFATRRNEASAGKDRVTSPDIVLNP